MTISLEAPYYVDGVGARRCHFCLNLEAHGHRAQCRARAHSAPPSSPTKGRTTMRLFDQDKVGCYLDAVGLRLEKTKDHEHKVIDLTLRVQPFTPELATALDPEVRALLFTMTDATPKPKVKACDLKLNVPNQHLDVYLLPMEESNDKAQICLLDAEISDPRVRTEKGVDGYALIFYATIGPLGRDELEYVTNWYTQQRFITFRQAQATMDFAGKSDEAAPEEKPRYPRRHAKDKAEGAAGATA